MIVRYYTYVCNWAHIIELEMVCICLKSIKQIPQTLFHCCETRQGRTGGRWYDSASEQTFGCGDYKERAFSWLIDCFPITTNHVNAIIELWIITREFQTGAELRWYVLSGMQRIYNLYYWGFSREELEGNYRNKDRILHQRTTNSAGIIITKWNVEM